MSPSLRFLTCSLMFVVAACNEKNSEYCQGHPQDTVNCPPDAGSGCSTDDQCAGKVCDTSSGACVVCTPSKAAACTGTMPVCSTNDMCEPCTMHSQCATSNVCLPDGSCSDGTDVAYVDGGAGSDSNACTKDQPCKTVTKAASAGRTYVKVHGTVIDQVTLDNKNVTVLADPGAKLTPPSPGSLLTIQGTSNVRIFDLEVDGANATGATPAVYMLAGATGTLALTRAKVDNGGGDGILCSASGGTLMVTQSTVSGNTGGGISASGGTLTVTQSTVSGNTGGGISVTNGSFDITNNFITRNGDPNNATVGGATLTFAASGTHRFEFNTVVDNNIKNTSLQAAGVTCDTSGFAAANNIISRNLVGSDASKTNSNTLGQCTYPTSVIGPTITALKFASPDTTPYDYHLTTGSSAIDQGTTASTVAVDFDGDTRPQGAASDQGADELK